MAELVPNYFFLNEKIYKKIRVVKSENYIVVWSYEDERRQRFSYSSVRREASKAYDVGQVARLFDRPIKWVVSYLDRRLIPYPTSRTYNISSKRPGKWMWSEKDILDFRDSVYELAPKNKYGEPYYGFKLISKSELLAKMRGDTSYYVKSESGEFVKVWKAL